MISQNMLFVAGAVLLPIVPAYLLFRLLPSEGSVEGPLHGLKIKLGGAFAGYFLLFASILYFWTLLPRYEVWTVHGAIELADSGELIPTAVDFSINPPGPLPNPNGRFSVDILAKPGITGDPQLPVLIVEHAGYRAAWRDLEEGGERNESGHSLRLKEPLVLQPIPVTTPHEH